MFCENDYTSAAYHRRNFEHLKQNSKIVITKSFSQGRRNIDYWGRADIHIRIRHY